MAPKIDQSPRKKLADSAGELWLEMPQDDQWLAGRSPETITDEIVRLVAKDKLGKYSGRSQGSGAFDVSFKVKNRKEAAKPLRALIKSHFPGLPFCVSDEYECRFHRETERTLLERLEEMENMALFLHGALVQLREEIAADAAGKT